jgi:sortase A
MNDPQGPYIVRPVPPEYFSKPGLHSHNTRRRKNRGTGMLRALSTIRVLLLLFGIGALGYYAYTVSDEYIYQVYQNWAFDQEIAGRTNVTFEDYVRERTPFGFLAGAKSSVASTEAPPPRAPNQPVRPAEGAILGRVEVARLNLAAVVREGVDAKILGVAVGHVPATALPGQPGNFAIAAHRDTLFRVLKDIQRGDLVSFEAPNGTYTYKVVATKIVRPTDVSVLRPDGGGLIPPTQTVSEDGQRNKLLTMITCYPFYYVGSAPKRFIVEAELVGDTPTKTRQVNEVSEARPARSVNDRGRAVSG